MVIWREINIGKIFHSTNYTRKNRQCLENIKNMSHYSKYHCDCVACTDKL